MSEITITEAIEKIRFKDLYCETCEGRRGNRWGGSAMTAWKCKFCLGDQMAGSTNHDSVCQGCAIKRRICQWCGINPHMHQSQEDIDKFYEMMKNRRIVK